MASPRSGLADVAVVWVILAVVALEVLATYTRIPVQELYPVRGGGIAGGAGRTLAFIGFPVGLAAIATLQAGLDATPARALAALGIGLALPLTFVAVARGGFGPLGREPEDWVRIVLAIALFLIALPWMAADLGLSLDRVPLLGWIFQTDALARQPGRPGLHPAVHDGHHHGMDGVLLALTAILLSRTVFHVRHRRLRRGLTVYLAFLFVYGAANAIQDAWLEQIVKRGWAHQALPMMLVPSFSYAWAVIVASTAAIV